MVRYNTIPVEIHLFRYRAGLIIGDKVASALHQASDFVLRNNTVTILVTDAEGFGGVEVRIALQALPCGFFCAFSADHRPHHVFEALCCGVGEDVVLALIVNAAI